MKTHTLIIGIGLVTIIQSCSERGTKKTNNEVPKLMYDTSFAENAKDESKDTSESMEAHLVFGEEQDTAEWKEAGIDFRAFIEDRHKEGLASLVHIEKQTADKWQELGKYEEGKYGNESVEFVDLNKDGNNDIAIGAKWDRRILMFSPKEKSFKDAGYFGLESEQVKGGKSVFYDIYTSKFDGQWASDLFKFDERMQRVSLGRIESISTDDRQFVKGAEVYKILNNKAEQKQRLTSLGAKEVKPYYQKFENNAPEFKMEAFLKDYWANHWKEF